MADVKICDRCGKKLTDERGLFNLKPNRYTLRMALFKRPDSWYSKPDCIRTEHDLCIDCTTKLAEWMEGEDENV